MTKKFAQEKMTSVIAPIFKSLPFFLIIIVPAVLTSCEYAPTGSPLTVVKRPDSTGLTINLGSLHEHDTIFLYTNAQLNYQSILPGNQKIYFVGVYIDNETILTTQSPTGSVEIETEYHTPGTFALRLELTTSSGTGSLADVSQQEQFKITRHYVLVLDPSIPDTPTITSIANVDGTLMVNWQKYPKFNFEKYTLTKYFYDWHYNALVPYFSTVITDKNVTSYRDSTFIGGQVQFSLTVTAGPRTSQVFYKTANFPYNPNLQWEWLGKNQMKFTWNKTPFYRNLLYYQLSLSSIYPTDARVFKDSMPNDTTLIVDPQTVFAASKGLSLIAYPYQLPNDNSANFVYSAINTYLWTPFPGTDFGFIYNATIDKYFSIIGYSQVVSINGQTLVVEKTINMNAATLAISDNGQYLYATKGDVLYQLDPMTLNIIQTRDLSTIHGSNGGFEWKITVSNNNTAALSNQQGNFVVDLNTFTVIQTFPTQVNTFKISNDGAYIVSKGTIYQWNGSQFVASYTYGATNQMDAFFRGSQTAMIVKNGSIDVVDLASMTLTRSIASSAFNVQYDPVSGLLGGVAGDPFITTPTTFYVFSPDADAVLKQFSIAGNMALVNNSLLTGYNIVPLSNYYP